MPVEHLGLEPDNMILEFVKDDKSKVKFRSKSPLFNRIKIPKKPDAGDEN